MTDQNPEINLYDTLTRQKQKFIPLIPGKVSMYHCGPTVYWNQHIGNMRAVVIVDLIRRAFSYAGYEAILVRNYTDVGHLTGDNIGDADTGEDRMEKAAVREHLSPSEIADKYIQSYQRDIKLLNTLPVTHDPRATSYIESMISMVQTLIEKGNAYITDQAVYFDITTYPAYTKLSGQELSEQRHGTGHGTVSDPNKKNPSDFALWFFKVGTHEKALQTWESPFNSPLVANGRGFPGWHIECSAMSKEFLGSTFDIHLGGIEHIPVHHTNEIAQSVCANGAPFAHYWLHNEHLLVDDKKMSKSEGTSYLLDDIIAKGYNPIALRYFFMQAQYRSKQNFTWEGLEASAVALKKLESTVYTLPDGGKVSEDHMHEFTKAILDDFNIPGGLAVVWQLLKQTNVSDADKKATILSFDEVLGLDLVHAKSNIIPFETLPEDIQELITKRALARSAKDWVTSDEIRGTLELHGYSIKDSGDEQIVIQK